ncbi:MAG: hypothetical protein OES32_08520 [Acidobacteriota bacterium]|nr:hypothetical protein [Acidobacteriota bacterium]
MEDLLWPGPQPPLSHFGVTLLRHVVVSGLRYCCYHLGLPLPESPPTRIERLRLALDGAALSRLLGETAEGRAVRGALLAPDGAAGDGERAPAGAAFFHRQRLRWARRRPPVRLAAPPAAAPVALEHHFRKQLSRALPGLADALLDEILSALERRRRRRRGAALEPCLGAQAAAWTAGRRARLECLGAPDPFTASWAVEEPGVLEPAAPATPRGAKRSAGGRGRFRELYRGVLDGLRPTLIGLGGGACGQGVLGHPDDLFFLPFELLGDLTGEDKPGWVEAAVARNRGEYFGLLREAPPATRAAWAAAPLRPLS